jgi:hypothetical protein
MSPPGAPSALRRLLGRIWPAWPVCGALVAIPVGNIVGNLPMLRPYRIDGWITVLGIAGIVLIGLPFLFAWALWSVLGIRHPAARAGLIAGIVFADVTLSAVLFLGTVHPQM